MEYEDEQKQIFGVLYNCVSFSRQQEIGQCVEK